MRSRAGRRGSIVVGVLALLIGLVWIGQGAGLLGGSPMTGHQQWLVIGVVVAVLGVLLLVRGLGRPRTIR